MTRLVDNVNSCDTTQSADTTIFVFALESILKYYRRRRYGTVDSDKGQQISALHMQLPPIASMKSNNGYAHKCPIIQRAVSRERGAKTS